MRHAGLELPVKTEHITVWGSWFKTLVSVHFSLHGKHNNFSCFWVWTAAHLLVTTALVAPVAVPTVCECLYAC